MATERAGYQRQGIPEVPTERTEAPPVYTGIPEVVPPASLAKRGFEHVQISLEEEIMLERIQGALERYQRRGHSIDDRSQYLQAFYPGEKRPWE